MMIGQQYYTASVTMKVENLTKVYASSTGKVVSLNNVSFSVNKGEFVSVVGPSGSGKSEVQSKEVPGSLALLQSFVNANVWTGETRTYERKHPGDFHNQSNQRGIQ